MQRIDLETTLMLSATSCSSPSRWRQSVTDDRSNGSRRPKLN
ncbi:hypothetical protein JOH48_008199 [Bradyrhizobium elkanii]|nr:hypothetical protein [Bradyrhizobium elkanii]MBP2434247.1 hypothetical protein [Bradyrhizobium elkanii]WLA96110.1 hypothetical protein QNJ96_27545 [Bradyrhizobium elkanii]